MEVVERLGVGTISKKRKVFWAFSRSGVGIESLKGSVFSFQLRRFRPVGAWGEFVSTVYQAGAALGPGLSQVGPLGRRR